ncbi:MAG TPA: hypothetical protein VFR18_12400 [Terriglobia bacterium]|nr:hypothetical protein [Terriglobia bacterium]
MIILRTEMRRPLHIRLSRRDFLKLPGLAAGLPLVFQIPGNNTGPTVRFLTYEEAEPIIRSGKFPLPAVLANLRSDSVRAAWPQWVRGRDTEIRSRLQRGDEDTLANFVLLGVSFTDLPRVTPDITDAGEVGRRKAARVSAFVDAVAAPGSNERLVFMSGLITRLGYSAVQGQPREKLARYVMENINRYQAERLHYQGAVNRVTGIDASKAPGISDIYKDRGLSGDTDFRPNYAIEQGLAEAKRRGLLTSIRRVAILGPGLDFTDKDSGFDHYPLQTLQPFAIVDSLVRLGLASLQNLRISVADISVPTLEHITRTITRARAQQGYTLQLVLDRTRSWSPGALEYWQRFATRIGETIEPLPPPAQMRDHSRRAVRIRPEVVRLMETLQLNAVLQRITLAANQRYDLVIATNILIYYSTFEQALALSNVESMLGSGGVLLTNDLGQEYAGVRLRPAAVVRVPYATGQEDQIQIYSRSAFQSQLPPA